MKISNQEAKKTLLSNSITKELYCWFRDNLGLGNVPGREIRRCLLDDAVTIEARDYLRAHDLQFCKLFLQALGGELDAPRVR